MSSIKENQPKLTLDNLQSQLARLKEPFLREANQTVRIFQEKVREYENTLLELQQSETMIQGHAYSRTSTPQCQQTRVEGPKVSFDEKNLARPCEPYLQEWKPNIDYGFRNYEELARNYEDVVFKKQKVKRTKNKEDEDFRADERNMILEIFEELKDSNYEVNFSTMEEFFSSNSLFYYFYNIHPNRLKNLLRESAKELGNKLTKNEFLDFFLIDRPNITEFKKPITQKILGGTCILSEEGWKKLKNIFDTLDTFGDEKIYLKTFFQRIKKMPSSMSLLSEYAIEFTDINRIYTVEKVLFDLENKGNFDSKVDWNTIEASIREFEHIEEPSLDTVLKSKIEMAQITKNSNYFMLSQSVLDLLKDIFSNCAKHYGHFVKTSHFVFECLESGILKPHLSSFVRPVDSSNNSFIKLNSLLKNLNKDTPDYIDMDEMLEFMSIKGYNDARRFMNLYDNISSDSSEDEQDVERRKNERKYNKMRELDCFKKSRKKEKKKIITQITKAKEFNLFKREYPTIRELRVQKMVEEKERQNQIELENKFKANPLPVSLNCERYQKYLNVLAQKKEAILSRLALKREQDIAILEYLKSNTKLFEEKKPKRHCQDAKPTPVFEATPLPEHISEELLPKISADKEERRKKILEDTRKKYHDVYWRNLRNSEFTNNQDSLISKIKCEEEVNKNLFKPTEVPNFADLHRKFSEELERRRKKQKPTQIKEFNLSSPKNKVVEEKQSPSRQFKSKSPPKLNVDVDIKVTKKYQNWVAYNQARMAEREIEEIQKIKEEEERQMKKHNFAKFMRNYLGAQTNNANEFKQKNQAKLNQYREHVRKLQQQTEKQLAEIYGRVLQRPFLFESVPASKKSRRKDKPKKVQMEQMETNMPENFESHPYKEGLFEKDGSEFHSVESENLNQSF